MKKIDAFKCDFCGFLSESEITTSLHEQICPKNPINQPCSECENMCIGIGCLNQVQMDNVDGKKVKCMFYKKGKPQTPMSVLTKE